MRHSGSCVCVTDHNISDKLTFVTIIALTSPVNIKSSMLVTCCMQWVMSVSLLLLITACISRS